MQHELRVEVAPPWPFRLARRLGERPDAAARRVGPAAAAPRRRAGPRRRDPARARPRDLRRARGVGARRDVGDPADALRHRRRRRPAPVPRRLPRRPGDRPRGARAPRTCASAARRCRGRRSLAAICEQLIEFERAVADPAPADRRATASRCAAHRAARRCPPPAAVAALAPARARRARPRAGAGAHAAPRGRRGRRRPASTCSRTTRCRAGAGCARSRASARGRSRCSPASARATTTAWPRATSASSSSSAASRTGNPRARADEAEVRAFFAPYGEWKALAGAHLVARRRAAGCRLSPAPARRADRAPRRPGTRSSSPARRSAAR